MISLKEGGYYNRAAVIRVRKLSQPIRYAEMWARSQYHPTEIIQIDSTIIRKLQQDINLTNGQVAPHNK